MHTAVRMAPWKVWGGWLVIEGMEVFPLNKSYKNTHLCVQWSLVQ